MIDFFLEEIDDHKGHGSIFTVLENINLTLKSPGKFLEKCI